VFVTHSFTSAKQKVQHYFAGLQSITSSYSARNINGELQMEKLKLVEKQAGETAV